MKLVSIQLFFIVFISAPVFGQNPYIDSLLVVLEQEEDKLELLRTNTRIGHYFQDNGDAKAIEYYNNALLLAEELDIPLRVANSHYNMAYSYQIKSDFDDALGHYLESTRIYEEIQDSFRLSNALMSVANVYNESQNYDKTEEYHEKAQVVIEALKDTLLLSDLLNLRGVVKDKLEDFDAAIDYYEKAYDYAEAAGSDQLLTYTLSNMALTYKRQGKLDKALSIFKRVLNAFEQSNAPPYVLASVYNNIGSTYAAMRQTAKAEAAFETSISFANKANSPGIEMEGFKQLAEMYGYDRDFEKQATFLQKYYSVKDSLFTLESNNTIVKLEADYQIEQKNSEILEQEIELGKQKSQRNLFLIISLSAVLLLLALAFFYRRIRGANQLLETKNTLINEQKDEIEGTLNTLKAAQAQLIQSEKMASLGELTAGIAHEIQNPLNFVNNFSDVNTELIEELVDEIKAGNYEDAVELATDIQANEEKIKHHGGRADSIVKGMLQHSRNSSGEKVTTDINALADEYLRLSYHGLRAKDNTFNATIETDFDTSIGTIDVVPQDIGRVLLNLITNAFQATHEKSKKEMDKFVPKVSLSTQLINDATIITISDNGPGIPDDIKDKIFQPFFTTKPTGQGTGLGLSLAYDIIKAHGGQLEINSKNGEGASFVITLPR